MEESVERVNELASSKAKENKKFFSRLKRLPSSKVDVLFHTAHNDVYQEFNCLSCANCCKSISPIVLNRDVDRIAKAIGMRPSEVISKYLFQDVDGQYAFRDTPCPFLDEENLCLIYPNRPKACREYPHTDRKRMHQILNITIKNIAICPVVFEVVERIKRNVK